MKDKKSENKDPQNVLLVDQGLSFGGSLIVLLTIANNLGSNFRPILVTAIRDNPKNWIDTGDILLYSRTPYYTYVDHFRSQSKSKTIPTLFLKKLYIYYSSIRGFLLNIRYSAQIYKIIKKHHVKVVHINGSTFVTLAAVIARAKCVWHIHGVPKQSRSLWNRILDRYIGKYISISDYVTRAAIDHGYPKERLLTLHNPVADSFIDNRIYDTKLSDEVRTKYGIQKNDFVIAVFGRIIKWKGQLEVVKALGQLSDRPNIKLMLVGDSTEGFGENYKKQIEEFSKRHSLGDRLIVTGFVRDVFAYYKVADLIVHSSIEPEPFGLVVIEAMASEKPVIASNLGATPELVDDGKDGLIIDPTATALMAENIKKLADDRYRCTVMGKTGLAKVRERFMPSQYGEAVSILYQELLDGKTSK